MKKVLIFCFINSVVSIIVSFFVQISFSIIVIPFIVGLSTIIFGVYNVYLHQTEQKFAAKDILVFFIINEIIFMLIRREPVLMGLFDKTDSSFHNENILISISSLISILILFLIDIKKGSN